MDTEYAKSSSDGLLHECSLKSLEEAGSPGFGLALVWNLFNQTDDWATVEPYSLDGSLQEVLDHSKRVQLVGLRAEALPGSLYSMMEAPDGRRARPFQFSY